MDAFVSGNWHHYIVVDARHYSVFKHLAGVRRSVLLADDVLTIKMRHLFNISSISGANFWWSWKTGLSIGWHRQQMIKIGVASAVKEDGLAFCDSDLFFVRPFNTNSLSQGGRLRLYRSSIRQDLATIHNAKYIEPSIEMLQLTKKGSYYAYIDNLVTWKRLHVLTLCDHLAASNSGLWQRAFRNRIHVSEYNLYGIYVDDVLKDKSDHFSTSVNLCRTLWGGKGSSKIDLDDFCYNIANGQVAVGIQSFIGIEMKSLETQFEKALKLSGENLVPEHDGKVDRA